MGLCLRTSDHPHIQKYAPILEPFCSGAKTQVTLINTVQVYCYEDTRVIKAFPQILKVCVSLFCSFLAQTVGRFYTTRIAFLTKL